MAGTFHDATQLPPDLPQIAPPSKGLDVGCGPNKRAGYVGIDRVGLPGVDVVHDLESVPWPFRGGEFDVIYASHVLEHLRDLMGTMEEIYRIAKPSAMVVIAVPHLFRPDGPVPAALPRDDKITILHVDHGYARKGIDLLVGALGKLGADRFRLFRSSAPDTSTVQSR